MRILAVTQFAAPLEAQNKSAPKLDLRRIHVDAEREIVHVVGYRTVVARRHLEGGGREFTTNLRAQLPGLQLVQDSLVLSGRGHDADVGMILRCGADHARAADVDVFDRFGGRDIGSRDRFFEGIQIHDDQFEGHDAMRGDRGGVFGQIGATEDRAMHFRM